MASQGTTTANAAAPPTPSASGVSSSPNNLPRSVHTAMVGNGGFSFEPSELNDVGVGETVTFQFYPPDHSVARAEFGSACVPYEYTGRGKQGGSFWSGTQYLDDARHPILWNYTVTSTEPIFYYCAAPGSCKGHQMVGVINPNSTQSLERQIQSAKSADFEVAPGGKIPSESSASSKAPEVTDSALPGHSIGPVGHSISPGGIVGIVIGGLCVVALCAALFFIAIRRKPAVTALPGTEPVVEIGSSSVPHSPAYQPAPPYHSWPNAAVARCAEVSPVSPQNQPMPLGPAELDPDQIVKTHAACRD